MLKKLIVLLLVLGFANVCFAANYPKHLLDDTNYVLCNGHQGIGYYVDVTSLQILGEDENTCTIYAEIVPAYYDVDWHNPQFSEENTEIHYKNMRSYVFLYDLDAKRSYMYHSEDTEESRAFLKSLHREYISVDNSLFKWLNPEGCWAESGVPYPASIIAYKEIYDKEFE